MLLNAILFYQCIGYLLHSEIFFIKFRWHFELFVDLGSVVN